MIASIAKIALLCLVALQNADAFAYCSKHPNIVEEFNGATAIYIGTVTSQRDIPEPGDFIAGTAYTLQVNEVLKGRLGPTTSVYSENTSGRFPMDVGVQYLIFASSGTFEGSNGSQLYISSCGNSGKLNDVSATLTSVRSLVNLNAARKWRPDVHWRDSPILSADFKCNGQKEFALLGISMDELIVALIYIDVSARPDTIAFPISRFNQHTIEFRLDALDTTDKEFAEMTGGRPERLVRSMHCQGLDLSDGEKDSVHIYWNHKRNKLSVWSL